MAMGLQAAWVMLAFHQQCHRRRRPPTSPGSLSRVLSRRRAYPEAHYDGHPWLDSLPALAHGPSEVGHSGIREIANEAIRTPGVIRLEVGQPNCAREWAAWPNSFATGRNQPQPAAF